MSRTPQSGPHSAPIDNVVTRLIHPTSTITQDNTQATMQTQQYSQQSYMESTSSHGGPSTSNSVSSSPQPSTNNNDDSSNNNNNKNALIEASAQPLTDTLNSFRVFGSRFILDARYVPRRGLGKGAYGVVISATDNISREQVAIKKIPRMFQDLCDALRVLRELKLLRHFNHENVIKLRDCIPSYGEFEELYMVLDFMSCDLHKIIYSNNNISMDHIRFIIYQLLSGLKYIHSTNVIHRDLKPSNLLINADTTLKICDFGLSRGYKEADYLTEYVVTRWYRAPEVMVSSDSYDFKIDVWAVGCILAELIQRAPLFPGDDYRRQLNLIFNALGTPTPTDCKFITNEFALSYIKGLPPRGPVPMEQLVNTNDKDCLDLLTKMLKFNPEERISVDEALQHPFLRVYYEWNTNHIFSKPQQWDNSFENYLQGTDLTKLGIQQYMLREIFHYHPEHIQSLGRRYGLVDQQTGNLLPEPGHITTMPSPSHHQPIVNEVHYQRLAQQQQQQHQHIIQQPSVAHQNINPSYNPIDSDPLHDVPFVDVALQKNQTRLPVPQASYQQQHQDGDAFSHVE